MILWLPAPSPCHGLSCISAWLAGLAQRWPGFLVVPVICQTDRPEQGRDNAEECAGLCTVVPGWTDGPGLYPGLAQEMLLLNRGAPEGVGGAPRGCSGPEKPDGCPDFLCGFGWGSAEPGSAPSGAAPLRGQGCSGRLPPGCLWDLPAIFTALEVCCRSVRGSAGAEGVYVLHQEVHICPVLSATCEQCHFRGVALPPRPVSAPATWGQDSSGVLRRPHEMKPHPPC